MKWQMAGSNPATPTGVSEFTVPVRAALGTSAGSSHRQNACHWLNRRVRVSIHAASAVLIVALSGCAHAIQPTAKDYTVPQQWARIGCTARGDTFKGLPVLTCPDGLRMVDKAGTVVEFVPWQRLSSN